MLQLRVKERRSLIITSVDSFTVPLLVIIMSSTLLFKFNGFDNLSDRDLFPDEIRDVGMNPGEWRETSSLTDGSGKPLPEANDGRGSFWGVGIYVKLSYRDVDGRREYSPRLYEIRVTKREANNIIVSRSLGYQITSRARIIVRDSNTGEIFEEKKIMSTDGSFCAAMTAGTCCPSLQVML